MSLRFDNWSDRRYIKCIGEVTAVWIALYDDNDNDNDNFHYNKKNTTIITISVIIITQQSFQVYYMP